ncbi:uncharacterized protein [Spinacia oleracea]|uniref:DUF8039 domain-containing protein n=3 Tax=Spinacia oleracea TaxID=3562 RepID=A0ABM3R8X4_SPIOL|nr:uncharacterized protein LOC110789175 [Spinacia oleracea]
MLFYVELFPFCYFSTKSNSICLLLIFKGDEASLQKALHLVYNLNQDCVDVLFYASWCQFSRNFRPSYSTLSSLYPSIPHFAIEESAIRPRCKLGECRILLCEPGSKHRLQKLQLNFPRTVATMDDHRDNEIQGIDGASHPTGESQGTNTSKKTKFRGPSKGVQAKKPMHLQYNQYGIPDGEWSGEYGKQVGSCAARININVKEYSTLDEHTKKGFWEETKLLFHIIDDPAKRREKYFHMCVAKRFGAFKSRLTRRWITKKEKMPKHQTNDMPWDIYHQITEDDWKTFVIERNKPEMLVRREKASKSALQNKHPHRTGQKGYVRKRPEWINDGRLPPEAALTLSSGSSSVTSSLTTAPDRFKKFRSVEWILAHQVKNKEGKWEVDPNDKEAVNIAKMALEYIEEEGKGNISFTQGEDALTKAMGKKDHRGRVKATGGVNVGYKVAFGPIDRSSRCGHIEPSPEAIESIRASVRREFEDQLERKVAEALQNQLATLKATGQLHTLSTPALDSALVSDEFDVNRALVTCCPSSSQQPRELKAITPCRLALEDKVLGNKVIVADGMAYPLDGSLHQHFRSMKPSHYKVQVDCIYDGHDDDTLPVPTGDGFNNLGRALASFVQWPIHLVIFEEDEEYSTPRPTKKSRSQIFEEVVGSSKEKKNELIVKEKTTELVVKDKTTELIVKEKATLDLGSKEKTTLKLTAKGNSCSNKLESKSKSKNSKTAKEMVFSCDRKTEESAAKSKKQNLADDTIQGLGPSCNYLKFIINTAPGDVYKNTSIPLPASVWHYDEDRQTYVNEVDVEEFLRGACLNISVIQVYMMCLFHEHTFAFDNSQIGFVCPEAMSSSRIKANPQAASMYLKVVFNAEIEKEKKGDPNITKWFLIPYHQEAYQVYKFNDGICPNRATMQGLKGFHVKCAQQVGARECGYYVMKFMHEIVTLHHNTDERLDNAYTPRNAPYTDEEIDVVREQWAKFFTTEYLFT